MTRIETHTHEQAEGWLRRAVRISPHPLPAGRFSQLLAQAEAAGFARETLMDVLDEWLGYGYCRIVDPLTNDIEVLPGGKQALVAAAPDEDEKPKERR